MVKLRILSKYIYIFYAQRRTKVTVIVKWNETHHVLAQFDAFILKGTFGYFSYQFIIRIYINMNIQAEQFNGWIFAQTHIFFFHPDLYNRSLRNRQLRAAIFKTYSELLLPCHMINLNHLYGFFFFFFFRTFYCVCCVMTRWSGVASYNEGSCPSAENRREQHRSWGDAIHLHCCLSFIAKGRICRLLSFAQVLNYLWVGLIFWCLMIRCSLFDFCFFFTLAFRGYMLKWW